MSRKTKNRIYSILMVFILVCNTVGMSIASPSIVKAEQVDEVTGYTEITVPNGDFESAITEGWTPTGDIGGTKPSSDYYYMVSSFATNLNKTQYLEICSHEAVNHEYTFSQTVTDLEPGTYKAAIDHAGGNDPGTYIATLTAGGVSTNMELKGWNKWNTSLTEEFEVDESGSTDILISVQVNKQYAQFDNVRLYRQDIAPEPVSVAPISKKVKIGETFSAPTQVSVLYSDGSTKNKDVTWKTEDLTKVDVDHVGVYIVEGNVRIEGKDYAVTMTVTVINQSALVQVVSDDAMGAVDFNSNWQFYLATRTPQVAASGFATGGVKDAGDYTTEQIIETTFDDTDWRTIDVPHDFSIEGEKSSSATDSQAYLQGGLGYYRKTFIMPESMKDNKKITVDFEGVYQNCIVYLNDIEIGNYPSGYTGFAFDITDHIKFGEENVLVVKVQNMAPSGRWYTGSGITRPVHLTVDNYVRFNRNGITLTSPELKTAYQEYETGTLHVKAQGYSDEGNANVKLKTIVYDAEGVVVTEKESEVAAINPSSSFSIESDADVENAKLWYTWNIGTPYLYTVKNELWMQKNGEGGEYKLVDTQDTTYGFRWVEVQESTSEANSGGLYINDVYTKLQGVDLHHDSGALGAASYKDAYERQFELLKDMGVNGYRTAHCPPSIEAIEVCEEAGILVVEEAYDGWGAAKSTYDFGNFFFQEVPSNWAGLIANGLTQVPTPAVNYTGVKYTWSDWVIEEMVNRDMNSPAVIGWSIGNEIRGTGSAPSWYDASKYDLLNAGKTSISLYTEAVRLSNAIYAKDESRFVVMGSDSQRSVPSASSDSGLINQVLDGFGLNYNTAKSVDGLINRFSIGDGTWTPSQDATKCFFFESESSSQTSSRGVYLDAELSNTGINQTPGSRGGSNYDNDFASWCMSNEYGLKKDRDRKDFIGQFIWSGFDYLGEPTPYGVYPVGGASFGTIDTAGFQKDSFYLFQSQWIDTPMVHLLPTDWDQWRAGEEVTVWVNTNQPTAELFLNGKSLGKKSFDEKETAYGKTYYETSENTTDDKTWGDASNPGGYTSNGAKVDEGETNYGKLHLTWKVPYEAGTLSVKAYDKEGTEVATDSVTTSSTPYTIQAEASKTVLAADGSSLSYVECTITDENGNMVADADNLVNFDIDGVATIVGVDNGQQENSELYKYDNVEKNIHSERTAYHGKVLVIVKSEKTEGDAVLTISSDDLKPVQVAMKVTADGIGEEPTQPSISDKVSSIEEVSIKVPTGANIALPAVVRVNYTDEQAGDYSAIKAVTWSEIKNGKAEGTVEGIAEKASAEIIEDTGIQKDKDLATNTALGDNSTVFSFDGLPENSPIRNGALATASFTGSVQNYPNNMISGNATKSWTNAYSRGASVLLQGNSASRKHEYVTFYWDKIQVLNQVELSFVKSTKTAIPSVMEVQYWDGSKWNPVQNQTTTIADKTKEPTTLRFNDIATQKVRVYMENATPYGTNGNMEITAASVEYDSNTIVDRTILINAIKEAQDTLDAAVVGTAVGEYTQEAKDTLQKAIDAATTINDKSDITIIEVEQATNVLKSALKIFIDSANKAVPVTGVTVDKQTEKLFVGETIQLSAKVTPENATNKNISWSSNQTSVAIVDETGLVTAVAKGTAKIKVTTEDGNLSAICSITVEEPVQAADRTALNQAIAKADNLVSSIYTQESYQKVIEAVRAAKALEKDATQEQVDAAEKAITKAIKELVKKPVYHEGWRNTARGWRYQQKDGTYAKSSWIKVEGTYYHFDGVGYLQSGWQKIDNGWYYLGEKNVGRMQSGWQKINGSWYYLGTKDSGKMQTGWQKIGDAWYYLGGKDSGKMQTGWQKIGNTWYYLGGKNSGKMQTGWQKIGNTWYYLGGKDSGKMKTGWLLQNKTWYYLKGNGQMVTGWYKVGKKSYYFNKTGAWTGLER